MTIGKKIAAGYLVAVVIQAVMGAVAYDVTRGFIENNRWVDHTHQVLEAIQHVLSHIKDAETGQRGYLLTAKDSYLEPYRSGSQGLQDTINELRQLTSDSSAQQERIRQLEPLLRSKLAELQETITQRDTKGPEAALAVVLTDRGKRDMDEVRHVLAEMDGAERLLLKERSASAEASGMRLSWTLLGGLGLAIVLLVAIAFITTRTLSTQVGSTVTHLHSSAAELQAAANQQVSGTREEVAAMHEITTTIRELLATSRQIAESSQQVSRIAEETANAARAGDGTVGRAQDAVANIRRQVDVVVTHMLDLGKRSQQIGSVIEIVGELAEQTNILSINATIEAAGAGEHGTRFAAVADEIRKLADRVGGSAKEIRTLVDEVRTSVNAAIMATETGSKSVDAGTKQFGEVAHALKQIQTQAVTTTQAAREIELSTKQQSNAVEQVNVAISQVSQSSKEMEASASQVLETASQLSGLSRELARVVTASA